MLSRQLSERVKLTLIGGTNVPLSPSIEYLQYVLLPTLNYFGINGVAIKVDKYGFMPNGGGRVVIDVQPQVGTLKSIQLVDKGSFTKRLLVISGQCSDTYKDELVATLAVTYNELQLNFTGSADPKLQLTFVATTSTGCVLGFSMLVGKKLSMDKLKTQFDKQVKWLTESDVCTDEHL